MLKYKFTFFFVLLAIFLVSPFILKLKDPRLEPYPAIILPSGARLVNRSDKTVKVYQIRIVDSNNIYSIEDFMDPLPKHFFYNVFKNNFGLEKYRDEFKLYKPPVKFFIGNYYTEEEKSKAIYFWKERVRQDYFIIQERYLTIDINSKRIIDKEILKETRYDLY